MPAGAKAKMVRLMVMSVERSVVNFNSSLTIGFPFTSENVCRDQSKIMGGSRRVGRVKLSLASETCYMHYSRLWKMMTE